MIKGMIFDLDNTLYDYTSANAVAEEAIIAYMAEHYGEDREKIAAALAQGRKITKQLLPEGAAQHSRILYLQHALELLGINAIGEAWQLEERFWQSFLANIEPYPGVQDMLEYLKTKHIKTAICTDLTAAIQHRKLLRLGLKPYMDILVTSEEVGREKPYAGMFNLVLEKFQLPVQDVAMAGDSWEKDILGAHSLGIKALWKKEGKNEKLQTDIWQYESYTDEYFKSLLGNI